MSESPIVIKDLFKRYGSFTAVDGLSVEVRKNSFTGFLGPNGAGKSTALKILTNLARATSGSAYLNGVDVTKDPKRALTDVGTVVETPEFYGYLTPTETMTYLGRISGMSRESLSARIPEILENVKMTEWADKRIGTFSKGMRQRIALGQSLLADPSVIILDEPTSGLDPRGMIEIRGILRSLKKHDMTIFISSHILYEVSDLCDRIAVIDRGKLLVHDYTDRMINAACERTVSIRTLHAVTPEIMKDISALPNVVGAEISDHGIDIRLNGNDAEQARLLREVADIGLDVFSITNDNLESAYMGLVEGSG